MRKAVFVCALFFIPSVTMAGQNLVSTNTRVDNGSVPAQDHAKPVEVQFEIANWFPAGDAVAELNAVGVQIEFSGTNLRLINNWGTGAPVFDIPLSSFATQYAYIKYQYDSSGILGPPKMLYCFAYDVNGTLQYSNSATYASDNSGYSFPGIYLGQNGNAGKFSTGFIRVSTTTLTAIGSRAPATADAGPWLLQWKFDGNLLDSSGNGFNGTYAGTPAYESTLFQNAIPIITSSESWRAGVPQTISGINSFSEGDTSAAIQSFLWADSGPGYPAIWSSYTSTAPVLTGLVAGSHNIKLQTTDYNSNSAVASSTIGAVATDSNDIVINSTQVPTNTITDIILGPFQKWKSSLSLYPLFDQLHGVQTFWRDQDFQNNVTIGVSSFSTSGVAYFDNAQAGTLSVNQTSYTLTGSGTSWMSNVCDAGDNSPSAFAAIHSSIGAGIHYNDPFTVVGGANVLKLAFDGGSPITVTLTPGSFNTTSIASQIQSVIGSSGTATTDFSGYLLVLKSTTSGTSGSVTIQTVANDAYGLLGFSSGTYTVANNPLPNMTIIPWYLTSTLTPVNPGYATGRRLLVVENCITDTKIIAEEAAGLGWRLPTQTNVQYAIDNASWLYYNSSTYNGNYYDPTLGDYAKALKTGAITDLIQARARADRWFRSPNIDMGQEYTVSNDGVSFHGSGFAASSRLLGIAGPTLRALDGTSQYWEGLDYIYAADVAELQGLTSANYFMAEGGQDQREFGYRFQRVALCALYDPNAEAASCRAELVAFSTTTLPGWLNSTDSAYPYFPAWYGTYSSWQNGGSVCVTHGSSAVVGTGTAFPSAWTYPTAATGNRAWFYPTPGTLPVNNAAGDGTTVYVASTTDATHLVLLDTTTLAPKNYSGTTGCTGISGSNKGIGVDDENGANGVAWGAQPFMEGLMAEGLQWAVFATTCTSANNPTNCNSAAATLLESYVQDAATWLVNVGYQPSSHGMYQTANFANCTPGTADTQCNTGNLPWGARIVAQEGEGGVSWAWRMSGTAGLKTISDAMYGAAWTNANGLPDYNPPSGQYVGVGNYYSSKYYGLMAGITMQPSYQAVATCSSFPCLSPVIPAVASSKGITFNLASAPTSTHVKMTVTEPDLVQAGPVTCTVSPCMVAGDSRQGTHLLETDYLNGSEVLISSSVMVLDFSVPPPPVFDGVTSGSAKIAGHGVIH